MLQNPIMIVLIIMSLMSWTSIFWCTFTLFKFINDDKKNTSESCLFKLRKIINDHKNEDCDNVFFMINRVLGIYRRKVDSHLSLIGSIGSSAAYIGLLGTVTGIVQAFHAIQVQSLMSPSVVSGGIAVALTTTAAGLIVAIPSVIAHYLISSSMSRRIELWEETIEDELYNRVN